jgi:hypothetical protein
MSHIDIRLASVQDTDSILALFLDRFPFLREVQDRARQDVVYRVTRDDSITVVAVGDAGVLGVARGYEQQGIYLMNSICTASSISVLTRSQILMKMLPYFVNTCIAHAGRLGLSKAFYSTEVKSLARLVPLLCNLNGYALSAARHNDEDGFWITKTDVAA